MNVSDYIINFLTQKKVDTIFMITGGQAMFLNDAVCRSKKIKYICNHHEQAVGMAAEAYGRISGKLGVALVTAGPASVNVMNGIVGAWEKENSCRSGRYNCGCCNESQTKKEIF